MDVSQLIEMFSAIEKRLDDPNAQVAIGANPNEINAAKASIEKLLEEAKQVEVREKAAEEEYKCEE